MNKFNYAIKNIFNNRILPHYKNKYLLILIKFPFKTQRNKKSIPTQKYKLRLLKSKAQSQ